MAYEAVHEASHEPLQGRTVLVTGAGGGAGAAVAWALSRAGASVVLAAGDAEPLEEQAARIGAAGGHAIAVRTDLTDQVAVRRLVEQTLGAFGRLDAACNDAACHGAARADVAANDDRARGLALAMRYEIASMRTGGSIVNLAPGPAGIALTRATARQLAGSGIRVNAVTAGGPDEVAGAVVWLCSDAATHITGETLTPPSMRPATR
ncbi:SDR family oxidoreductase [Nonomuraea fuscirosea]|uniref:SDR family oxidoreductase n=1 Tax=Nonomuraea fuscirosea TaxID=1291556 RepID=UPI002DDAAB8C|nr:SDR family oxidoreductase [Nonomuraea fuscirosea]WSA48724.1 SDR family oxidoreductase [Nonomuraea fuscirosea]